MKSIKKVTLAILLINFQVFEGYFAQEVLIPFAAFACIFPTFTKQLCIALDRGRFEEQIQEGYALMPSQELVDEVNYCKKLLGMTSCPVNIARMSRQMCRDTYAIGLTQGFSIYLDPGFERKLKIGTVNEKMRVRWTVLHELAHVKQNERNIFLVDDLYYGKKTASLVY